MNRLKRFAWFIAGLTAVALVVTLGTESRAIAQAVRAALVRNQDEPGRNPYFETRDVLCTSVCLATFSPVPAGQRLVVTFVSAECCQYGTPPKVVLLAKPNTEAQGFQTFAADEITAYASSPVIAYFEAGETPVLFGYSSGGGNLVGTLSGYYISLP